MKATRHAELTRGKTYKNRSGGSYRCIEPEKDGATLINEDSLWRFCAHVITMYENGTIEWDYSTGGFFEQ